MKPVFLKGFDEADHGKDVREDQRSGKQCRCSVRAIRRPNKAKPGRAHFVAVLRDGSRRMRPESTVVPSLEIVWKCMASPAISTRTNERSWSYPIAIKLVPLVRLPFLS